MDRKRRAGEECETGERATPSDPAAQAEQPAPSERFGPLALTRLRKDDGRALLLYAWTPADADAPRRAAEPPDRAEQPQR
jgi:hypothetical protein